MMAAGSLIVSGTSESKSEFWRRSSSRTKSRIRRVAYYMQQMNRLKIHFMRIS